jgi:16S rRNA (guanine966-N2)-methyltransferase
LRIVSGIYRGRNLHPPGHFRARPTTDFAKVGLFNILNNYYDFSSIRVLDLFAGTGSISFEFASRGCRDIELVENDRFHMAFIRKVIREWKIEGVRFHEISVFSFLKLPGNPFDLIFCDPPYDMKGIETLPDLIMNSGHAKPGGWLILEHSKSVHFHKYAGFREERHYGSVHFTFFEIR